MVAAENETFEIGIAKVQYDNHGRATEAEFVPTIKLNLKPSLLAQLASVNGKSQDHTIDNANLILGAWFEKSNEIELADRDTYHIASEIVRCEKWSNGTVKVCEIRFVFKKR